MSQGTLKRSLTPTLLWGLGVGYVISGMYFGWNLGLQAGGTLGMALATLLVIILYVCFTLCYAELACAIPKAGGVYDYSLRAFGKRWGFVAGLAQLVEFTLAPPAIAAGIGAHVNLFLPEWSATAVAVGAYLIFTLLNALGVKLAASFELVVAVIAVIGILIFAGVALPHARWESFTTRALPNGWAGIGAAIPFAVWFFLGIEGMANAAEESIDPQRHLTRAFAGAMATLVVLCLLVSVGAVGIAGWEAVVFKADGSTSDSPLPLALTRLVGEGHFLYQAVILFGLFGLVASFHGLLMAAGRASYEMGRTRQLPAWLGQIHGRFQTPVNALLVNFAIGVAVLLTNSTANIIVFSVIGALVVYGFGAAAVLRLRHTEPTLSRPFSTPYFPTIPFIALGLAVVALIALLLGL